MATGRQTREVGGRTGSRAVNARARPPQGRALVVGTLLIALVILGGVAWLAGQRTTVDGTMTGAASRQPTSARSLALPATQGGMVSLREFAGHKVVLYFYEAST